MLRRIARLGSKRLTFMRLISLVLVVLTLELASRWFRPGVLTQSRFDPDLGYLMKPNLKEVMTNGESQVTYELTTNSLGFRGPEWTVPKPNGVKRIAVLGDSFVEARSYEEHRVFCGRLEKLLNDAPNEVRWEVMNLGMSGHNTATELALYEKIVKPLEPDYVVVCVTLSNDIRDNDPELSRNNVVFCEFTQNGEMLPTRPMLEEDREIMSRSKLYLWQKEKVQFLINRVRNLDAISEVVDPLANTRRKKLAEAKALTQIPLDQQFDRAWRQTAQILEQFRNRVTATGSRFVVVSIPNAWQIHEELFEEMRSEQSESERFDVDQPIERLASICNRVEIPLIELVFPFREDYAGHPEAHGGESTSDLLFLNGIGHFSEHGHEVTAQAMFEFFRSDNLESLPRSHETIARDPQSNTSQN